MKTFISSEPAPPHAGAPRHAPAAASPNYQVAIKPLSFFLPSEHIDPNNVERLIAAITAEQAWTTPVPVVAGHGIVMDGNHRVHAARIMGLRYLPCVPLEYGDPRVTVRHWDGGAPFCADTILRTVLDNRIFPYKTTRHCFDPVLPSTHILLSLLGG